ncbi:integrase [Streptomyces cyaneofuscatus]|uniref:integrase n=1 Tax=Streptomyces cyaneofuscatus TaxID=66883 RepID=UPI00365C36CF
MSRPVHAYSSPRRSESVFAGLYVCEVAGLRMPPTVRGPMFDEDLWVLADLVDAHRMVDPHELIWDFTEINNAAWRVVAKEVLLAMLAPQYQAVLECANAIRSFSNPRTCYRYLMRFVTWFNWLTAMGITSLDNVTQDLCEQHLEEMHWSIPKPGRPRRRLDPNTMAEVPRGMQILALYSELLSTDRYPAAFAPWEGKTAAQVVGRDWAAQNRTPPVPDALLQPLLATCLYLVEVVGPHIAELVEVVRADAAEGQQLPDVRARDVPALRGVIAEIRGSGEPLPAISAGQTIKRNTQGDESALKKLAWSRLARRIGARRFTQQARTLVEPELAELAAEVGFQRPWAQQAGLIPRSDNGELIAWTGPLGGEDVELIAGYVITACLVLTSALSGMRSSELLEIEVGCRQPFHPTPSGGKRFRLAGRLIKRQRFGGIPDEWVVVEQVDRAVALAERLTGRADGEALFGTVGITGRLRNLRNWLERTGNRERWGLPVIPEGPASARMLRRTLALSIAHRPGGLLAAKIALKHISVATTEGYAARPGGSQRLFLAEVQAAEQASRVQLTVEAFRDVQAGRMPSGRGARSLIEAFQHVDAKLKEAARSDPKVLTDDRHLESLLRKQAKTLHVGPANFCWFRDPSKALCLKLAGTPNADRPLLGMCDSARCSQATHHRRHRPVWLGQIATIDVFVESPRVAKGEKLRLAPERDRAVRVVAEIDAAAPAALVGKE